VPYPAFPMTALEMSPAVCEEQPTLVDAVDAEAAALKEFEDLKAEMSKPSAVAQGGRHVATPGVAKRAQAKAAAGASKPVGVQSRVQQPVAKKLTTEELELLAVEANRAEMKKIAEKNKRHMAKGPSASTLAPSTPNSKAAAEGGAKTFSSKTPERKESVRRHSPAPEAKVPEAKAPEAKAPEAKAPEAKVTIATRPQSVGKSLSTRQASPALSPKVVKPLTIDSGKPRHSAARAATPRGGRSPGMTTSASSPRVRSPSASPAATAKTPTEVVAPSTESRVTRGATSPQGATSPASGAAGNGARVRASTPTSGAAGNGARVRASTPTRSARASTPVRSAPSGAVSPKPQPTHQRGSTLTRPASKGAIKATSTAVDTKVSVHAADVQIESAEAAPAAEPPAKDSSASEPAPASADVIDGANAPAVSETSPAISHVIAEGASADGEGLQAESPAEVALAEFLPVEVLPAEVLPAEVLPADVLPAEVLPAEVSQAEIPPAEVTPAEVPVTPAEVLPAEVLPAEVLPAEVLPAEVPSAEVLPAEVPIVETPTSESPVVEVQSVEGPLADDSCAEVLEADMSAEVLEAELPSELEISSVETPSEMLVQVEDPSAQEAAKELDEAQTFTLYVQRLVARTLEA